MSILELCSEKATRMESEGWAASFINKIDVSLKEHNINHKISFEMAGLTLYC